VLALLLNENAAVVVGVANGNSDENDDEDDDDDDEEEDEEDDTSAAASKENAGIKNAVSARRFRVSPNVSANKITGCDRHCCCRVSVIVD
jgi:hypothetical protein